MRCTTGERGGPLLSTLESRGERLYAPAQRPAILGQPRLHSAAVSLRFRGDSDLEAFSHNPTDGSFAPLAPQPSTYTKCLNLRFLSY